jgi:hypothetical protein
MTRETSIRVFNQIKEEGILCKRKLQVYQALFDQGPLTQSEVINIFGTKLSNSIRPRFAELERMGAIQVTGERVCTVTGRMVLTWDVTKNMPVKVKKPKKIKCEHCNGKGHFIQETLL